MARLEYIRYEFYDAFLDNFEDLEWLKLGKMPIDRLPQIFWDNGCGWDETNLWALERASSYQIDAETIKRTMKHLNRYANFLEIQGFDWRHFPVRKEDQVLRKYRKHLIDEVKTGLLASSTASSCMNAIIQFYRFADRFSLVNSKNSKWSERTVVLPFYDSIGFKRSMVRITTDLKIPNRMRLGAALEDGLLPLRGDHVRELLTYTAKHAINELHLMLSTGFLTGARIGTITTLTVSSLHSAREDLNTPGLYRLAVGPGTGIATKYSVSGEILVPEAILADLKAYTLSTRRLLREAKARQSEKNLLFLTQKGRPYTVETVNRLVYEMRQCAVKNGLEFMRSFRFHQSRATFGTWLMQVLLDAGAKTDAIRVVRDAMLHKDEKTTLGYITFLENTRAKEQCAAAFNEAFTGLRSDRGNDEYA